MENTEIENIYRTLFHCWVEILHPNDSLEISEIQEFYVLFYLRKLPKNREKKL